MAWRPFQSDMTSAAVLHTDEKPAVAGGVFCSTTKVGDVLLGDVLCPALQGFRSIDRA